MPDPARNPAKGTHIAFEASVALKGAFALLEVLFGVLAATPWATSALEWLHASGLYRVIADPSDMHADFIHAMLWLFGGRFTYFWPIYMIVNGGVKLLIVYALLKGKYQEFPSAIAVMVAFIIWQMLEWRIGGDTMLLALSVFDGFVIWLTWKEWRAHRAALRPPTGN